MKDKFVHLHHEIEKDSLRMISVKTALIKFMLDKGYYFDVQNHLAGIFENYTFNHILSLWASKDVRLFKEEEISLNSDEIIKVMEILFDESISLKNENEIFISEIYQSIYFGYDEKITDLNEFITDILRNDVKLHDKIFNPFCEAGILLSGTYDALMHAHYKAGSADPIGKIHEKILTQNIYGCDESNLSCAVSALVLALKYKEFVLCENIVCQNHVETVEHMPFDWIVADFSENNYGDKYSFQSAYRLLSGNGKLVCMFSRDILHGQEEKELRKAILTNYTILKTIDISGSDFSELNYPLVFYLEKGLKHEHLFEVLRVSSDNNLNIAAQFFNTRSLMALQDELSEDDFDFYNQNKDKRLRRISALCPIVLENVIHFFQGIISGCDKAFVVHQNSLIYAQCIRECGVPWIKGKELTDQLNFYGQYLLYTNGAEDIDRYPLTKKRLEMYKSLLLKRRECVKGVRKWYELQWGREKELFLKEKIIFSAKSKKNNFIYDNQGYFFSADINGAAALDSVSVDLKKLALLLNSDIYEWYMKNIMKQISNGNFAYYPDTLKQIRIPPLDVIASFEDETDIHHYFGFNIDTNE